MVKKQNYYALLGLTRDASPEDIRRAYHEAARRLHPDVNIEVGATELFLETKEAYEVLSDPEKRASYNASLPVERPTKPLTSLTSVFSRSTLHRIPEPQVLYTILELAANAPTSPMPVALTKPPLNVALVIDRSTSMQGERMDMVKQAAIELLRQARPEDRLSVVVFSDRAETLLGSERPPDRAKIETDIRMIRTGGGTEILRGLEAAFFEVRRSLSKGRINHIVLLTDGQTYGDEEACLDLAEKSALQGIGISGLGIGSEWNDVFLDKLATRTGGSSAYISRASDIVDFLKEKFSSLEQIFATQVSLDLQLGPDVELLYAFRLEPEASPLPLQNPVFIGNIPREKKLSVLLEFLIPPTEITDDVFTVAGGSVALDIPSQSIGKSTLPFKLVCTTSYTPSTEYPSQEILQAVSQVTLYRMQERAHQDAEAGNYENASRRLHDLATHLLTQGRRELAQAVLLEAENLRNTKSFSEEGSKRIKYETRALGLAANISGFIP
jgi:Ca-activated chloride channel family protein